MDGDALTHQAAVVICARNRAALIVDTLESVLRNRPQEIIVVDDRSTDDTAAVARRYADTVIPSGGHGLAAARQLGAEQARCPYVVYVDSDAVLDRGCIGSLVAALERDSGLGAASAAREPFGPGSYWSRCARETRDYARPSARASLEHFPCTTVAIRRRLILEIGFDRCADAVVRHRPRDSFVGFVQQQIWYGRGAARLAYKRAMLPGRATERRSDRGWRTRLIRDRRFALLPYAIVSGGAHRLGVTLERRRLRRLPAPTPQLRNQGGDESRTGSR